VSPRTAAKGKGRCYVVTPLGRAALAEPSGCARIQWQITSKGQAALAEQPRSHKGRAALAEQSRPKRAPALNPSGVLRGESTPITDIFTLYGPLLRNVASDWGVGPDECAHLVTTLLDDVVLRIIETQRFPKNISSYMVVALKNRVRNRHRNHLSSLDRAELNGEAALSGSHSEYAMRASLPDAEIDEPSRTLLDFSNKVSGSLSDTERSLLENTRPMVDIARQLGISYGTARVKLHRTRARLRNLRDQFLAGLGTEQRREVERLLNRAGSAERVTA
jgi:DNA-directed RNA polymerase specialized sigma24 family protein